MNLSATDEGGDLGREVRIGRLPGELEIESLCWFFANVGTNSGPSSRDRKREDKSDSSSSNWKLGEVRYVVESESVPIG